MALRLTCWLAIASAVVFVLVPPNAIFSCGPFFDEAVFVPPKGPQVSQKDFAAGKLGIVLPTLRRTYLVVAYRYLSGLSLVGGQQQAAIDVWNRNVGPNPQASEDDGPAVWRHARNQVPGVALPSDSHPYAPVSVEQPYQTFLNCPEDAFRAAAATLADRIQKYRADTAAVREWLAAQDQVFKNCDGKTQLIPAVLAAKDPLLRSDRNYQIAAPEFYARRFDDAAVPSMLRQRTPFRLGPR